MTDTHAALDLGVALLVGTATTTAAVISVVKRGAWRASTTWLATPSNASVTAPVLRRGR
jgi:hypothetical protein